MWEVISRFLSRKLGALLLIAALIWYLPDFDQNIIIYIKIGAITLSGIIYMIVNLIQNICTIMHLDKEPINGNGTNEEKK